MPIFFAFVAYLLGAMLLSALLLPMAHPWIEALAADPIEADGVLSRLAMLFMLLGLPWFLRSQGLLGWRAVGFAPAHRPAWLALFQGLGIGFLSLLPVALCLLLLGARQPAPPAGLGAIDLLQAALAALIAGLLVGLIEETFFAA